MQSVLGRFCRFGIGLCSGSQICRGEIFQPTKCRLPVGYVSVWSRFCRGAFGGMLGRVRPPMPHGLSVLNQLCIGHLSADLTPTLDRIKSDITTNCEESADTFPNQDRHEPNTPRTQTECKPTTVCDVTLHIKDVKMPYSPVAGQIL